MSLTHDALSLSLDLLARETVFAAAPDGPDGRSAALARITEACESFDQRGYEPGAALIAAAATVLTRTSTLWWRATEARHGLALTNELLTDLPTTGHPAWDLVCHVAHTSRYQIRASAGLTIWTAIEHRRLGVFPEHLLSVAAQTLAAVRPRPRETRLELIPELTTAVTDDFDELLRLTTLARDLCQSQGSMTC